MKKSFLVVLFFWLTAGSFAQNVSQRIEKAYRQFAADSQLRHAISSLYVINAKTGKVVFDRNSQIGLAPASTQKIVTAATAFELLGKDYRYKTELGYKGEIKDGLLKGDTYIVGAGDPTFGSWRWQQTKAEHVLSQITSTIRKLNIRAVEGSYHFVVRHFEEKKIPDGWIWQDIGNYYGAAAEALNWHENQYDLILRSGAELGSRVEVVGSKPELVSYRFHSEATAAAKGTGDNAYIYLPVGDNNIFVTGTIPIDEKKFTISGCMPEPKWQFYRSLLDSLLHYRIEYLFAKKNYSEVLSLSEVTGIKPIYTHYSPSVDSIIYWFLQRSINLYGEALIKTLAFEKKGFGATDSGIVIVKDFWKQKGIDEDELNMMDGSGLSPQNRVTTHAQVEILKYASTKDWFPYFYAALPTFNGMKMKSGSIRDVRGYCGYHRSVDGNEYIFSFLVNNYAGLSSAVVNKMYKVLDVLK